MDIFITGVTSHCDVLKCVGQTMQDEASDTKTVFAPSPEHPMKAARWAASRFESFGLLLAHDVNCGEFVAKWEEQNTWVQVPAEEIISCLYLLFEDCRYIDPDEELLDEELSKPWLPDRTKSFEVLRALRVVVPQLVPSSND